MEWIYNRYRHFFWITGLLLLLVSSLAQAQVQPSSVPFVVKGQCMANPNCVDDSTSFNDTLKTAVAWRWDFGDAVASPDNNTSTRRNPSHSYATPGMYTVTLVRTLANGTSETITLPVMIGELPPMFQNWKPDTTICPDQTITLDPYPNGGAPAGAKFIWYPKGDTTQTLTIDSSGCYSVEVILPNGCKIQDRVNVKVCLEPAGGEGAKWFFGANAGLDFAQGRPTAITDGKLNTPEGTSSIANSKGELLFYTDGLKIFDKDGNEMPCEAEDCAPLLKGNQKSTQSALIVPQPTCRGCDYLYTVFTTTEINATTKQLTTTVVDMRRQGGKGAIVEQNTLLQENTTERLASVRNDADSTFWIITHDYGTNVFRVFHATTGGLTETGTFPLGMAHDTPAKGEGYMKFSSVDSTSGKRRLAVVVPGPPTNYVELFTFSDSTGTLEYERTINLGPAPPKAYGVEFSPDGEKLYVSYSGNGKDTASLLVQFDISLGDSSLIAESRLLIDSTTTAVYGALQAGPDGRIYLAIDGSDYLGVINEPDRNSVSGVDFDRQGVSLGGRRSQLGLPSLVQNFTQESDGPGFQADGFCTDAPTTFQASPLCQPIEDVYTWNFGDGSAPKSGKETQVQHTYRNPGIYRVTMRAVNRCKDTTFVQEVEIFATPPAIDLGQDQDVCRNSVDLNANVEAELFIWLYNGRPISRQKTLKATQPGQYVAIAANGPQGICFQADTLELNLRRPPAFSLGPDTTMCRDSAIVLNAPGLTWREFKWSTGETTRDITIRRPGTYFVEVKNGNDCYNGDTLTVVAAPRARISADLLPPTGCTTADGSLQVRSVSPAGTYNYTWTRPDNTPLGSDPLLSGLREGSYQLRVSGNLAACTTDTTFALRSAANPLRMSPVISNAACTRPDSGAIGLNITGGQPTTFRWLSSTGRVVSNAPTAANLVPGTYSLETSDAGGCTFTLTGLVVGLTKDNVARLRPVPGKCVGESIELEPLSINFPGNQYLWSTGATTRSIQVLTDGTYTLTVRNPENGCEGSDRITLRSTPPPTVDLAPENPLCEPESGLAILEAKGRPTLSFFWLHSSERTPRITVDRLGTYTVQVTSPEGCTIEKTTQVVNKCEPRVFIPDAFTPNGDGQNDFLDVFGLYFRNFNLKIYNRWGEVIFAADSIEKKWDGTYRGLRVQPGSYAYVASFESDYYPERAPTVVRGSVMVIR
jgi:gliding motility-associated-like protein